MITAAMLDEYFGDVPWEHYTEGRLGRSSKLTPTSCELEISRFGGNSPRLSEYQVANTLVLAEDTVRWVEAPGAVESLTGGKNGDRWYPLKPGVLYYASGVLESGYSQTSDSFVVVRTAESGDVLVDLTHNQVQGLLRKARPEIAPIQDAQKKLRAQADQLVTAIEGERAQHVPAPIRGIDACPQFRPLPQSRAIYAQLCAGTDPLEIVALAANPTEFRVFHPAAASGQTPEEAVVAAEKIVAERAQFAAEAAASAEADGLPTLSGSPKQVAWALTLRAAVQRAEPKNPALRRATTAKYWIDAARNPVPASTAADVAKVNAVKVARAAGKAAGRCALKGSTAAKHDAEMIRAKRASVAHGEVQQQMGFPLFEDAKFWIGTRSLPDAAFQALIVQISELNAKAHAAQAQFYALAEIEIAAGRGRRSRVPTTPEMRVCGNELDALTRQIEALLTSQPAASPHRRW